MTDQTLFRSLSEWAAALAQEADLAAAGLAYEVGDYVPHGTTAHAMACKPLAARIADFVRLLPEDATA